MSFLNGVAAAGTALSSFGATAAKDQMLRPDTTSLANAMALLNRAPPADSTPAVAAPAGTPVPPAQPAVAPLAPVEGDSAAHGNTLDTATVGRAHAIADGLVKRGMDPTTATAFAANAVQESRADPNTAPGDMGASHGAFQWRGDRLASYVARYGHTPGQGTLDEQLDFVTHEISGPEAHNYKAILATADDPAARAAAVSRYFERPKDTDAEMARRAYIASQLAGHFARLASADAPNRVG